MSERAVDRHECFAAVAAAAFNAAAERGVLGLIARGQVGSVLGLKSEVASSSPAESFCRFEAHERNQPRTSNPKPVQYKPGAWGGGGLSGIAQWERRGLRIEVAPVRIATSFELSRQSPALACSVADEGNGKG